MPKFTLESLDELRDAMVELCEEPTPERFACEIPVNLLVRAVYRDYEFSPALVNTLALATVEDLADHILRAVDEGRLGG
jgi:hypothetical protein